MLIHQLNGLTENHRLCVTRNPPPMWTVPQRLRLSGSSASVRPSQLLRSAELGTEGSIMLAKSRRGACRQVAG